GDMSRLIVCVLFPMSAGIIVCDGRGRREAYIEGIIEMPHRMGPTTCPGCPLVPFRVRCVVLVLPPLHLLAYGVHLPPRGFAALLAAEFALPAGVFAAVSGPASAEESALLATESAAASDSLSAATTPSRSASLRSMSL